jgi:hypothetical protein
MRDEREQSDTPCHTRLQELSMNTPRSIRPGDTTAMRWTTAVVAFAIAAFLMLVYVRLLHESVEHGAQIRYSQRGSGPTTSLIVSGSSGTAAEIGLVGTNP